MKELIRRLANLEPRAGDSGLDGDFRVIEMQISRAEDKILRLGCGVPWTRPELALQARGSV